MNIHHKKWLNKSAHNSAEREMLHQWCLDCGFQQLVQEATWEQHLLDLVLSDVDGVRCKVLPKIADHGRVLAQLKLPVPASQSNERIVWRFLKADWEALQTELSTMSWDEMDEMSLDSGAEWLTQKN